MRHPVICFASCLCVYLVAIGGCTPTDRNFGGSGQSGAAATGGGGMAISSGGSGGNAGGGGATMCPPSTADCDGDGSCETNLLGDVDHCGACDNPCIAPSDGMSSCLGGQCQYSCGNGTMDCDQDPTTCEDVVANSNNCGTCGHDCFGGACVQGACEPVLAFKTSVATNDMPVSLAVFGQEIHWGTLGGQVAKAFFDGTSPSLIGMVNGPTFGVFATNKAVYATNGNRITAFFPGGGQWQSVNDPGVNHVVANETFVVWTATGGGRIRRADALGGNQKDLGNVEKGPTTLVLDGDFARWTCFDGSEIREASVSAANGAKTILAGTPNPDHLVQDGTMFFWVSNEMVHRAVSGANPEPLFPTGPDVRAMVADSNYLYWSLGTFGEVWRASKMPPYDPRLVAKAQAEPHAMAVGSDSIFWANRGDGTILRLAR